MSKKNIPLIVANWKMNMLPFVAAEFCKGLINSLDKDLNDKIKVVIAPSFISIPFVADVLKNTFIEFGAQNSHWEEEGAYTGEVSPNMLKSVGCRYVIIGHSERRQWFNENDEIINKKISTNLKNGLTPILCVGELAEEKERGRTEEVVLKQLSTALNNIKIDNPLSIVIAYEPVWAIGTGKTPSPDDAQKIHRFIRDFLSRRFGAISYGVRIIYGGSVNPENIRFFIKENDIDGALVGGASLKLDSFTKMVYNVIKK